jgi:hypothetical protein
MATLSNPFVSSNAKCVAIQTIVSLWEDESNLQTGDVIIYCDFRGAVSIHASGWISVISEEYHVY